MTEIIKLKTREGMKEKSENQKIDCGVAAYTIRAIEELTRLNSTLEELRWRIHRGEPDAFLSLLLEAKRQARKLIGALDMVIHCAEHPSRYEE